MSLDRYEMRGATRSDLLSVASRLREADRQECAALGHADPQAIYRAMLHASEARVGVADGVPVVAFGLGYPFAFSEVAHPWLLGTNDLLSHRHTFLRESRGVVRDWRERFRLLENWVDARNTVAIAWLKWLGFTLYDAAPRGPHSIPFHRFELRS